MVIGNVWTTWLLLTSFGATRDAGPRIALARRGEHAKSILSICDG
jgi:hypothetical protein